MGFGVMVLVLCNISFNFHFLFGKMRHNWLLYLKCILAFMCVAVYMCSNISVSQCHGLNCDL